MVDVYIWAIAAVAASTLFFCWIGANAFCSKKVRRASALASFALKDASAKHTQKLADERPITEIPKPGLRKAKTSTHPPLPAVVADAAAPLPLRESEPGPLPPQAGPQQASVLPESAAPVFPPSPVARTQLMPSPRNRLLSVVENGEMLLEQGVRVCVATWHFQNGWTHRYVGLRYLSPDEDYMMILSLNTELTKAWVLKPESQAQFAPALVSMLTAFQRMAAQRGIPLDKVECALVWPLPSTHAAR